MAEWVALSKALLERLCGGDATQAGYRNADAGVIRRAIHG